MNRPPSTENSEPSEKLEKTTLVELKNGKLVFKQKSLIFEKMSETMQEIVKFREMIEERMERKDPPLASVPDEHKPLIAKLVHESDKTIQALSKHILSELLPTPDGDGDTSSGATPALTVESVEKAIKAVATRNDFGLENVSGDRKIPSALHIWRWEVKQEFWDWLPKAAKEKVEVRSAERRQARKEVNSLFQSLREDEKNILLGSKAIGKASIKLRAFKSADGFVSLDASNFQGKSSSQQSNEEQSKDSEEAEPSEDAQQSGGTPKGPGRPKKPVDPEKAAKEKEKQEKRAAREEKEKKAREAQDKARSMMANFFGKTKAPLVRRSSSITTDSGANFAGPSSLPSEFEKTFKSFVLKRDAKLAPTNWFQHAKEQPRKGKQRADVEVIVLDDDCEVKQEEPQDVEMKDAQSDVDVSQMTAHERLRNVLSTLPPSLNPIHCPRMLASHLKTHSPHCVRAIVTQLNEAEVAGDDTRVRTLLAQLRDRTLLPAKVLIFSEDVRPGYFGTWTRASREIGPRAPFARDIVSLDYACDSGEEWEEEAGDADDVVEDAEEEDAGEEEDSDLDSWLVDDDETEPGTPIEDREGSPDTLPVDLPQPAPKRKARKEDASKQSKKRKVVVPLVPFTKGPCWESTIGQCQYEPFQAYRIELFNDTPYPIDPFKFVSTLSEEQVAKHMKESSTSDAHFAVPALPARLEAKPNPTLAANAPSPIPVKRAGPKTPFPEAHVPLLLERIGSLATPSLPFIIETIYNELKEQRVKKNAIEAKVRELAEKCREKKVWVVKPDVKASHGLA
ncbi:hypothetical protein BKA93DRAFT_821888 [Sparassis latifolia]